MRDAILIGWWIITLLPLEIHLWMSFVAWWIAGALKSKWNLILLNYMPLLAKIKMKRKSSNDIMKTNGRTLILQLSWGTERNMIYAMQTAICRNKIKGDEIKAMPQAPIIIDLLANPTFDAIAIELVKLNQILWMRRILLTIFPFLLLIGSIIHCKYIMYVKYIRLCLMFSLLFQLSICPSLFFLLIFPQRRSFDSMAIDFSVHCTIHSAIRLNHFGREMMWLTVKDAQYVYTALFPCFVTPKRFSRAHIRTPHPYYWRMRQLLCWGTHSHATVIFEIYIKLIRRLKLKIPLIPK